MNQYDNIRAYGRELLKSLVNICLVLTALPLIGTGLYQIAEAVTVSGMIQTPLVIVVPAALVYLPLVLIPSILVIKAALKIMHS